MKSRISFRRLAASTLACLGMALASAAAIATGQPDLGHESMKQLNASLKVGDVVFIRVSPLPFRKVSEATGSWVNHVGIVIDVSGREPLVAESTFPFSRTTAISRFIARSENGRVAIERLDRPLTTQESRAIKEAARKRLGIFYDTGFNLNSPRQFCSRFVHEVFLEATGTQVGQVETFKTLLGRNPHADLAFWRLWYFENIPWDRKTVTPASVLSSPNLNPVFDGFVG